MWAAAVFGVVLSLHGCSSTNTGFPSVGDPKGVRNATTVLYKVKQLSSPVWVDSAKQFFPDVNYAKPKYRIKLSLLRTGKYMEFPEEPIELDNSLPDTLTCYFFTSSRPPMKWLKELHEQEEFFWIRSGFYSSVDDAVFGSFKVFSCGKGDETLKRFR